MPSRDKEDRLNKYHRPMGVLSGGIVGLVIMAIPFLFWRDAPTGFVWAAIVISLLGGMFAGYKFPKVADAGYAILSLFGFHTN